MFGTVNVPIAVYDEITVKEQENAVFSKTEWIKPIEIKKDNDYKLLDQLIGKGEAEAIILAKESKALLLVDDAKARKYAILLGVEVMGTLGLLKLAKTRGVIPSVKAVIRDMLAEGYYIDGRLITKLFDDVGES